MGSRADVGSSIKSTSGSTARALAMQSRCCWPPESPRAGLLQPVLYLIPDAPRPVRALLHDLVQLRLVFDAVDPGAIGDVVVNAHGEGIGLLEYHAHLLPQQRGVHAWIVDILVRPGAPSRPSCTPSTRSFMRFKHFKNVDLPQPEGPIRAMTVFSCDIHIDIL